MRVRVKKERRHENPIHDPIELRKYETKAQNKHLSTRSREKGRSLGFRRIFTLQILSSSTNNRRRS